MSNQNALGVHSYDSVIQVLTNARAPMEGSTSQPSDSNPTAPGASEFLAGLPSRGLFSSTVISSNPEYILNKVMVEVLGEESGLGFAQSSNGGMRVYICDHDTAPPEGQQIKTNQQNILIRSLMLRKQKGEASSKDVKGVASSEASRKRVAERPSDSRTSAKRANSQGGSRQEGSNSQASNRDFQNFTVERLRALLKSKGLSPKGKKAIVNPSYGMPWLMDELIARLKGAS
ncbi:hypothetical protein CFP56_039227 [Quercus suber]|uniref:DET1- and DDB1-associated protein 1 domain-containing protein n=1 Tax=Quercus suber TaxID=58331 RepID=A0AAW0J0F9_QUESU